MEFDIIWCCALADLWYMLRFLITVPSVSVINAFKMMGMSNLSLQSAFEDVFSVPIMVAEQCHQQLGVTNCI